MQASDGYQYGMTFNGGNNLAGTAFHFDPITDSLAVIHHFNGTDGANPSGDFVEIIQPSNIQGTAANLSFAVYPKPYPMARRLSTATASALRAPVSL